MTLEEVIQSIHALETRLQIFEEKYKMRSDDFYKLAQDGKLEQSNAFIEWLGLHEINLRRERKYHQMMADRLATAPSRETLSLPLAEPPTEV